MSGAKERSGAKASPAAGAVTSSAEADNVETRDRKAMEAMGAGALAVFAIFDEAASEDRRLPLMVLAAKLFLIAFAFIAPVLLMWQHAF